MPKTVTVALSIPSVPWLTKASNSEAVCHLPARMTAGESINLKTALKSPYLSLQIIMNGLFWR